MSDAVWPLPDLDHPVYGPFWAGAAEGRLVMQRCGNCGYVRWPPEAVCPECLSEDATWDDVPGRGTVWSIAVYEHAFDPSLRGEVPYVCALVELDAGPRLISRLVNVDSEDVTIGMAVTPAFEEIGPGVKIVCFEPEQGAG